MVLNQFRALFGLSNTRALSGKVSEYSRADRWMEWAARELVSTEITLRLFCGHLVQFLWRMVCAT